jgi:AAA+ ATPase superfamily predicted ATPase
VTAFYNRESELRRLDRFLAAEGGGLSVVYGRRRCGKSTLLRRALGAGHVYVLADQREAPFQIKSVAGVLSLLFPAFERAEYAGWDDLFAALYARPPVPLCICLDEFPYLVQSSPELPSVLQRYVDRTDGWIKWILCGSSQRMMQGLALDRTAPLYGRARELLRITPLRAGWITKALKLSPDAAVEAFSIWGGVPRYWELVADYETSRDAIVDLVWDQQGVLHEEPMRLLLDDMRSASQPYSILSLIGAGCHRVSEIAARSGKPMTSIMRPLTQLCELGYVRRDIPFGEQGRNSKLSLYRMDDSFMRFYFRFVLPYQSALAQGVLKDAEAAWHTGRVHHVAACWEQLARLSVPWLNVSDRSWGAASAWWNRAGGDVEIDVMAFSTDGKEVLAGECKWLEKKQSVDVSAIDRRLRDRVAAMPLASGKRVITACWLGGGVRSVGQIDCVFRPEHVLAVLK